MNGIRSIRIIKILVFLKNKSVLPVFLFSRAHFCTLKITEILKNMNERVMCGPSYADSMLFEEKLPKDSKDGHSKARPSIDESGILGMSNGNSSDDSEVDKGNEFLDKITITTDVSSDKDFAKKSKLSEKNSNKIAKADNDRKTKKRPKKQRNLPDISTMRPNHFIAIKVSNPEIHHKLKAIQQSILEKEPRLESIMIDVATSHLTLLVMHLTNDVETEKATDLLRNSFIHFQEKFADSRPALEISGLDHFRNQVLFAGVNEGKDLDLLKELAEDIHRRYVEAEMNLPGYKDFNPHLTIGKMGKDKKLFSKGIKKISRKMYEGHVKDDFGLQAITELQLCSMDKPKDESGYYHVCSQFNFDA